MNLTCEEQREGMQGSYTTDLPPSEILLTSSAMVVNFGNSMSSDPAIKKNLLLDCPMPPPSIFNNQCGEDVQRPPLR